MALTITHSFVSSKVDGPDNTLVKPSDWNADHSLTGLPNDASVFLDGTGNFSFPSGVWSANEAGVFVLGTSVGINNDNPQAPLHINRDTGANTQGVGIRINSVSGSAGCGAGVLWTDNNDVLEMAMVSGQDDDLWGGRLVFFTADQGINPPGGTMRERMRITSAGDVAVGATSASGNAKLYVFNRRDYSTGILAEAYTDAPGNSIGIRGVAIMGSTGSNMFSIIAGAPTLDHGGTTQNAYGLLVEDVNVATELNCAIRTGAGAVWIADRLWVGDQPICDNAKITVYQNMSVDTNSSMVDMVGFAQGSINGSLTDMTVLNVLPTSTGDVTGTLVGVYVKSRIWGGTVNASAGIKIDGPEPGESSIQTQYGLYVSDQEQTAINAYNIYSAGTSSYNRFEGFVGIGVDFPDKDERLHVQHHSTNAIAIVGEGYTSDNGGTSIGVKGIASVGTSNQANELASLCAGSPETDNSATVLAAIGLKVEDVVVGQTTNWAIKTGLGLVQFNDKTYITTGTGIQPASPISSLEIFNQDTNLQGFQVTCLDTNTHDIFAAQVLAVSQAVIVPVVRVDSLGNGIFTQKLAIGANPDMSSLPYRAYVACGDPALQGLTVQSAASQTANIFAVVNENGESRFVVDPSGGTFSIRSSSMVNTVSPSDAPVFDCKLGNIQEVTTNGNLAPTFLNFITGQEITVIIHQDQNGPRSITWPGNVIGGKQLPVDNSTLVQKFVVASDSNLYAI
jgi:hypothetical protein